MLFDLLEDLFGDWILKGLVKCYRNLEDQSAVHPRRAAFGKLFLLLAAAGGAVAWLVFRAYREWAAEDTLGIWLYISAAGILMLVISFMGLRRFLRWRKTRKERIYDPRYQP